MTLYITRSSYKDKEVNGQRQTWADGYSRPITNFEIAQRVNLVYLEI